MYTESRTSARRASAEDVVSIGLLWCMVKWMIGDTNATLVFKSRILLTTASIFVDTLRSLISLIILHRLNGVNQLSNHALKLSDRMVSWFDRNVAFYCNNRIIPILRSLHWLPVRRSIVIRTVTLAWKCIRYVGLCVRVENVRARPRGYGPHELDVSTWQECTINTIGPRNFAFYAEV